MGNRRKLVSPEVKTDIEFAVFVQHPAEENAEGGKDERPGNGPGVIFNHETGDDISGAEKNGGVQENLENSEGENVQRERQEKKNGPDNRIEKPEHERSQPG